MSDTSGLAIAIAESPGRFRTSDDQVVDKVGTVFLDTDEYDDRQAHDESNHDPWVSHQSRKAAAELTDQLLCTGTWSRQAAFSGGAGHLSLTRTTDYENMVLFRGRDEAPIWVDVWGSLISPKFRVAELTEVVGWR